jgi:TRAP-type C4-dicarboxylate transport system substrate-binding protein
MRAKTRHIAVLAAFLLACALGACSSDEEATKAGGSSGPVTLRIGTFDVQGTPGADQIEEFARSVEKLSDGDIRVKPVFHAAGDGPDWDQRVARKVTDGELQMGLIPSRSWDTEGVTSLRALNAPFLITSDELVAEVVSGELASELMSGLEEAGVVGLALLPEGLRHPFGLKRPLLGPANYEGKAIRTPTSRTTTAVFEALGATANDEEPNADVHAGVESSYLLDQAVGTATGNVTFYPKVNSLVVNAEVYDRLDDGQRDVLAKAATETREWAIDEIPTDVEAARAFCGEGNAIVVADEADVAALERATQRVYAELERDQQTATIIAAIRELKRESAVSATTSVACGETDPSHGSQAAGGNVSEFNGVYRFEITDEDLREAGVTDPNEIAENHGVYTYTLKDGDYCWEAKAPNVQENPSECSTYEVRGTRFIHNWPTGEPDVYRWSKTEDGDLRFTMLSAAPEELALARAWTANTWKRIGDAD